MLNLGLGCYGDDDDDVEMADLSKPHCLEQLESSC